MTVDWAGPAVSASAVLAGALLSAWVGGRAALGREVKLRKRTGLQEAANEVGAALRSLRKVVRASTYGQTVPRDVSRALLVFQDAWDRHEHRFPERWPSLQREVNQALGTHFGPVGWSNVQLDQANAPLAPVEGVWAERAENYLGHLIWHTAAWGEDPESRRPVPLRFDPWLAECERRSTEGPPLPLPLRLLIRVLGQGRASRGRLLTG